MGWSLGSFLIPDTYSCSGLSIRQLGRKFMAIRPMGLSNTPWPSRPNLFAKKLRKPRGYELRAVDAQPTRLKGNPVLLRFLRVASLGWLSQKGQARSILRRFPILAQSNQLTRSGQQMASGKGKAAAFRDKFGSVCPPPAT